MNFDKPRQNHRRPRRVKGDMDPGKWLNERTFHHSAFMDLSELAKKKQHRRLSVSVGLPTLNVAETLGPILGVCQQLKQEHGLIDQIAVIDGKSTDETVPIALAGGAEVFFDHEILPHLEPAGGKGEALWKSLSVLTGDIIIWIDSDISNIHPRFVYGLLGPLLSFPEIGFVKAFYQRPLVGPNGQKQQNEGGRVTEICARPLLSMFWPPLAGLVQPLSGEYAARRQVFESIPFFTDYAVEIGILVQVLKRYGLSSMSQVDLEERIHTNQPLAKLGRMSFTILQAAFKLIAEEGVSPKKLPGEIRHFFSIIDGEHVAVQELMQLKERPPLASLEAGPKGRFPEKV
jgi:glucosyl-3-phosphoglycerate synthase